MLARRQPDLTVVMENVHDPHNVSAILRSCDGVGVLRTHAVYSIEEPPPGAFARQTSASAAKWVEVERHASLTDCYKRLRAEGFAILVTSIGPDARSLYECDLRVPVALVLGNEMRGVSDRGPRLGRRRNPDPDGRYGREFERLCGVRCLPVRGVSAAGRGR